jgi:hypothetical protein
MKFPSLQSLFSSFRDVFRRFPLEMAFALLGTCAAIVNVELSNLQYQAENICARLIMVSNLGLALSVCATLLSESKAYSFSKRMLTRVLVVICTALFFLLDPLNRETDIFRFLLLAIAFHLLVSFAGFFGSDKINAFWQFNKSIFLRFLTGALYSAVLFIGISAAIGSMNLLFNFKFEWDTFSILWIIILGLFQTVFFLSGVPQNLAELQGEKSYPKGLKIFTQYVLIPLASVYAAILLAYTLKIIIQFRLPEGLVSNLILGYAVFGILSLLLVYPIRDLDENKWIKSYSRSFYYLLIPLIGLLIFAVVVRVVDYGVTEERYFLIILAGWLSFITGYFLISKHQNITLIPLSLCIVALFSVYGPQGAFETSRRSQVSELRDLFVQQKSVKGDKIIALKNKPDEKVSDRMTNIIDYLISYHGLKSFSTLIETDLTAVEDSLLKASNLSEKNLRTNKWEIRSRQQEWIYKTLNVNKSEKYSSGVSMGYRVVEAENSDFIPVSGSDYLLNFRISPDTSRAVIRGTKLSVSVKENVFKITYGSEIKNVSVDSILKHLSREISNNKIPQGQTYTLPGGRISQQVELDKLSVKVVFKRLSFDDKPMLYTGEGVILIKVK